MPPPHSTTQLLPLPPSDSNLDYITTTTAAIQIEAADPQSTSEPEPEPETDEDMRTSTLYPKISGKVADLTYYILRHSSSSHGDRDLLLNPIPLIGTVKLHGTHADILVYPSSEIVCQSRNRTVITPESDNLGFALFCSKRGEGIRKLIGKVRERWRERHPSCLRSEGEGEGPVILAGEWIGQGIQRDVATAKLEKCFVLCGVQVGGVWEPMELYADLEDAEQGLLNVERGGFYHLEYSYLDEGAAFLEQAKELTLAVAGSCPFGKAMGVEGEGEGIVWTPAADSGLPNTANFWFKTKGEQFRNRGTPVDKSGKQAGMAERGKAFALVHCTESRMEQAWAFLLEMGIERSMKGVGSFLGWLTKDIEVEEKRDIEEMKLGKAWKAEVTKIAKPWYEGMMQDAG